jgi:hypothetical protein
MQSSIIITLFISIILAAYGFYAGYYRPMAKLTWLAQACFGVMIFLMIPSLIIVLWVQSGAQDRLAETGFTPHPGIEEPVGMAVGFGKNAKWVFKTDAAKDSIFNFYRDEDNSIDWELINEKSDVLIFRRGKRKKMVIGLNQERSSNTLRFTQTVFTD